MEKAYAVSELVVKLKGRGLDLAENGARMVAEEVFAWVEESAKLSSNTYDDMAAVLFPMLKDFVFKQIDKIDNKVG